MLSFGVANAQIIDQVSIGPAYAMDAFYDISTGTTTQMKNIDWDLGFSAVGGQDAGIFINEGVVSSTSVKYFIAPTNQWSDTIKDTDQFQDSMRIWNNEINWTSGALNDVKNPTDPFDFGWGKYDLTDHTVKGSRIFIVKKRNGSFLKLQISSFSGGAYNFKYANLDGSNEVSKSVSKSEAGPAGIILFSFETGNSIILPGKFDLMFTRYYTPLADGEGGFLDYLVAGVLLGPKVKAVEAAGVNPETVAYADYASALSDSLKIIGHEWKAFNLTTGWAIPTDLAFFVKLADNSVYKLVFLDFEGSSTGISTIEKTFIATTSSAVISPSKTLEISPNPVTNYFTLKASNQENLAARIIDLNGRLLWKGNINTNVETALPILPTAGTYHMVLETNKSLEAHSFIYIP